MDTIHAWWLGRALQDRQSFRLAVTAGLGSGKSHERALWHFMLAKENAKSPKSGELWPTYLKVIDAAIPTYQKVFESLGLTDGRHYSVIRSPFPKLKLHCLNGHEIHFLSAQHPERIAASEYSHGSIDEAGIISALAVQNFVTRVRDNRATRRQILEAGAPQGINQFAENWDSDSLEGWHHSDALDHWKELEIEGQRVRFRRFKVWTDHNRRNLPPEYIPNLMATYGHNPNIVRSLRYGEFTSWNEGAVYSNYLPAKDDIEDVRPDPQREIALSFDFNAAPLAWVSGQVLPVEVAGRRFMRLIIEHEASDDSTNLDDAVIEFAAKHPANVFGHTLITIYGDMTGHAASHKVRGSDYDNIRRILRQLGFNNVVLKASRSNPRETDSVESVQRLFRAGALAVCRRCKLLRKSLVATAWKKGVRKIDKPAGDTWTHHSDALKYLVHTGYSDFHGAEVKKILGSDSY